MRSHPVLFLPVLLLIAVVATAAPASAEWFVDVYLGAAVTQNAEVEVKTGAVTTTQDVLYGSSPSPGVRVGRWLDATPWLGFAVDASYFGPQNDLQVIPISALAMARLALMKSADHPGGALQPYVAGGLGLFISHLGGDLGNQRNVSDTSVDVGADVRVGVAFFLQQNLAFIAEYRFTHVAPTFSHEVSGTTREIETTFNTHAIVVGASFRF